jgi:hypothetical protein
MLAHPKASPAFMTILTATVRRNLDEIYVSLRIRGKILPLPS